jgi:hypothetical protein
MPPASAIGRLCAKRQMIQWAQETPYERYIMADTTCRGS